MKKVTILLLGCIALMMTSCYSHRNIGYLQEPTKSNKIPVYDSAAYEPYRIRVNDEVYTAITEGSVAKGDVLGTARIAGIMAAKRTPDGTSRM